MKTKTDKKDLLRKYGIVLMLLALIIYFAFGSPYFLTGGNIVNVLRQSAVTGISAVGLTYVMLTGGIDLSIGAVIGLTAVIASSCMAKLGMSPILACFIALCAGVLIGLINGILINYVEIPPLIATLGVMTSVRGLCYILTGGLPVYGFPASFDVLGKGYVGFIPVPVIVMILVLAIGWYVLNRTQYGRYLYAIGGSREASRLSGINVDRMILATYMIAGFLSALAGLVELSRLSSGQPAAGDGFEMNVITAVVLGGISVNGGEGKLSGVVVGIFIMSVLANGLVMMNVYEFYQQLIRGIVLIFAVGFDQLSKRKKSVKKTKGKAA